MPLFSPKDKKTETKKSSIEEIREAQIKAMKWKELGEGSFNQVHVAKGKDLPLADDKGQSRDHKGPWVRRKALNREGKLSQPGRQKRLFKIIEPKMACRQYQDCLFMPYYGKEDGWHEASDKEKALKCLNIFKRTGRILIDGNILGNIISRKRKVVCIDAELAVRPDSPIGKDALIESFDGFKSSDDWYKGLREYLEFDSVSEIELDAIDAASHDSDCDAEASYEETAFPKTTATLLVLVYLAEYFGEDEVPKKYLTLKRIEELKEAYDRGEGKAMVESLLDEKNGHDRRCLPKTKP